MPVIPDTIVVAIPGDLDSFSRGYLYTGYSAVAVPINAQSFVDFPSQGYAFDVVGAQVVAVDRGPLYTFAHGMANAVVVRIGSFKNVAIYPIGAGSASNLAGKFDPARGYVSAGPQLRQAPSTTSSSWNQQGITFIPPVNATFMAPWFGTPNLLRNGDLSAANPYQGSGEVIGWAKGTNVSTITELHTTPPEIDIVPTSVGTDSFVISDAFEISGSTSYFFTASAYTPNSSNRCTFVIDYYSDTAATALISQVTGSPFPLASSTWVSGTLLTTSPSNAVRARIEVHNQPSSGTGEWFVRGLSGGQSILSAFNLYVDALNIQPVDAATISSPSTASLVAWAPPRALQVNITSDPHTTYQDLTYRMSIMNRILQQSVPVGMRVLQPTFSS